MNRLTETGEFQSDKHPDLPPDRIRLSFTNARSERALRMLAQDYAHVDEGLAADINARLDALYGQPKGTDTLGTAIASALESACAMQAGPMPRGPGEPRYTPPVHPRHLALVVTKLEEAEMWLNR